MTTGPVAAVLPDGKRLHLQHGPIDLIVAAEGQRELAFAAAIERFRTLLGELMDEYALLRVEHGQRPRGQTAELMYAACSHYTETHYITPMAAVAGSVAETILEAMRDTAEISRAYVNNGGDIALHLADGQTFETLIADHRNRHLARISLRADDSVRGIATSGQSGRSLSFGIADSVTVLAKSSSMADAAATLIANAVDLPGHPAIERQPASQIRDDSDLGDRLVVTGCGHLFDDEIEQALASGADLASRFKQRSFIEGAALFLRGRSRVMTNGRMIEKRGKACV